MRRLTILAFATLLVLSGIGLRVSGACAQEFRNYSGEFLELGVGARSLAMGGAGVATSNDATAGYWNPAGLNDLVAPMVAVMHESRFNGTVQYNYAALGIALNTSSSAALSIFHIGISDIKDTRNALVDLNHDGVLNQDDYLNYDKVSTFGNFDWVGILSYAKKLDNQLSYGVNAKVIYRRLDPETSGTGLGFDVGARYKLDSNWIFGAVAEDITTTLLSYSSGTKELVAPALRLGASYLVAITSNGYHRIVPTVDADLHFDHRGSIDQVHAGPLSANVHLGVEYQLGNVFALRGGFNDMNMWSAGAGVAVGKFHVDYAFLAFNGQEQLGNTHRVSLTLLLDQPKWRRG